MRKSNNWAILIIGILLFLIAYSFDQQVSSFFKNIKFMSLNLLFSIITNFGVVLMVVLVIPSVILYKKNKKLICLLSLAFAVSFILAFFVKLIILRPRPMDAFTYPFTGIINYSFPSMHAMVIFALLPILVKYLPKQKYFWIAFAFLAVFSRIYFGFHFLSDVVFGAVFGYFIGKCLLDLHENGKLWKK